MTNSKKRLVVRFALMGIAMLAILIPAACDLFGSLDDPADPNSPNYQGYPVVDQPNKVVPMPPSGVLSYPPTLYASKLLGALAYRFQIASDQDFMFIETDHEQQSNIFVPSSWVPSKGPGTYYFRVQARKDPTWGSLSTGQSFTLGSRGTVVAPTFSVLEGNYASSQNVTISTSTAGALIRYTLDGSTPSPTTGSLYSTPIQVPTSLTINAIAYKPGWTSSNVSRASYTINGAVLPPNFSLPAGTYTSAQNVTISCESPGTSIRYTTDGSEPTETHGTVYTTPIAINISKTLKAIAYKTGFLPSTVSSANYIITGTVSTPVISPTAGTYTTAQTVSITCGTEGALIRYTLDGSSPSSTEGTIYAGSFTLANSAIVKAIAYKADWENSAIASATYTITGTIAAPSFSPGAGTYTSPQSVSISTTPSDATIRYTLDGTTPTETNGTVYSGDFQVSSTKTIKAIAYKQGWATSQISEATYTITGTVPNPIFSPIGGSFSTSQYIKISNTLEGSSIRYTIDGTDPSSTNGFLYSGLILVESTTKLKALAFKKDWLDSEVVETTFTYIPAIKYKVFYQGNGNTSGVVPIDNNQYLSGDDITIKTNTGLLEKEYYAFKCWNTESDGTGIDIYINSTIRIESENLTLYAKWYEPQLGDIGPAGGLVYYDKGVFTNGWRYLEAIRYDLSTSALWGSGSTGGTSTAIGTGEQNTKNIVAYTGTGIFAAKLCNDLILNGYDDWFLPSLSELNKIFYNIKNSGNVDYLCNWYWSSSEEGSSYAWAFNFNSHTINGLTYAAGGSPTFYRSNQGGVIAVRAF